MPLRRGQTLLLRSLGQNSRITGDRPYSTDLVGITGDRPYFDNWGQTLFPLTWG